MATTTDFRNGFVMRIDNELWSIVEFRTGATLWGAAFLGLAAYAGWTFFLSPVQPPKDPPA